MNDDDFKKALSRPLSGGKFKADSRFKSFATGLKGYDKRREEYADTIVEEDEKTLRQEAAKRLEEENKKPNSLLDTIGSLAAGANETYLRGGAEKAAGTFNYLTSGLNAEEADKKTKEFSEKVFGKGDRSQTSKGFKDEGAFEIGKNVGRAQDLVTEIASLAIPGAAAEKAIRGTRALQTLSKSGRASRIGADVIGSVGGGIAGTAAGAALDPRETIESIRSGEGAQDLATGVGIDTALGLVGGLGSAAARAGKAVRQGEEAVTDAAKGTDITEEEASQIISDAKQPKLLSEPGKDYYKPEADDIQSRLDRLNSNDLDYLEENDLVKGFKDDGRLASKITQNPERVKAREESSRALVDAENEVAYYNNLRVESPYFRQIDKIESAKQAELQQLDEMAQDPMLDPRAIDAAKAEVEAKYEPQYQALNQKYPQEALEAPAMDQAQQVATQAKLEAQDQLERLAQEDKQAIMKAGGMLRQPDTERIVAHKQQLEARQKQINDSIAAAQKRMETPVQSTKDVDERIEALQLGDKPEFRKPDGSLNTQAVKKEWKNLQEQKATYRAADAAKSIEDPKVISTPEDKDKFLEEAAKATDMKAHQSFTQLFQTPTRLLKKMGLNDLAQNVDEGFESYRRGLAKSQNTLQKLSNDVNLKGSSKEKVADALNGKEVSLNAKEQKAVDSLRTFFKEYADKVGLPEERRIADYFPHMYDGADTKASEIPFELKEIVTDKFNPKTKAGSLDYSRLKNDDTFIKDPIKVALAYARQAERRINLQPVFKNMNNIIKSGDVDQHTAKYIENYGRYLKGDQPTIDKWIDDVTRGTGTKALRGVRSAAYRANLQMNVGTALRNLTQATNTTAEIGATRTIQGTLKTIGMLTDAAKGDTRKIDELNDMGVFDDVFHTDGEVKIVGKFLQKFDKAGWAMFQATEKLNRGTAYFGAKAKYLAKHPGEEEAAKKFAADTVAKTQFHFNEMDQPPILRSQAARTAFQYQSFNIKQAEYLADMLGGSAKEIKQFFKGDPKGAENTIKALRWTGANLAMVGALGSLMGVKFEEMIPNPLDQRNYGSPAVQLLFGDGKGGAGLFDVVTGRQDANQKIYDENGEEVTDPVAIRANKAASFLQKTLPAVTVPWGTQAKKTSEGLETVDKGYSQTDSGNIRFQVGQNDDNRLQAGIFGQYTLPEAQQFYKEGGKNLSPQSSDKVKGALPEERDQYYTFYSAAGNITGRQKANKEITSLFQNGEPEKARRKAAEFNAKVDEKMAKYYSQYPDMDDDLLDELNSNLYIRLTERGEKQRAKQ